MDAIIQRFRCAFHNEHQEFIDQVISLTGLKKKLVSRYVKVIEEQDAALLFRRARDDGQFDKLSAENQSVVELATLLPEARSQAREVLRFTSNNILLAIGSLEQKREIPAAVADEARFRFIHEVPKSITQRYVTAEGDGFSKASERALAAKAITPYQYSVARFSNITYLPPKDTKMIQFDVDGTLNLDEALGEALARGLISQKDISAIRLRDSLGISKFEAIAALENPRSDGTIAGAIRELHIKYLIREAGVIRQDATDAYDSVSACYEDALAICLETRARQLKVWEETLRTRLPTADTRAPPDVDRRTHIIAVLGVDKDEDEDWDGLKNNASPSLSDSWMVSDFYLWMHVLNDMGKSQKWLTCLPPASLVEKYSREDKTTVEAHEERKPDPVSVLGPAQIKQKHAFVHGDPFEERAVVLDEETLPLAQSKVTIGPHGIAFRQFFLDEVQDTMAQAAVNQELVLILIFSHGDWDSKGLYIGSQGTNDILSPSLLSSVLSPFPEVPVRLFTTSCFSGHWVKTPAFNPSGSTVLPVKKGTEGSRRFVWSTSQRHAGAIFSNAALEELMKQSASLPLDAGPDESRTYLDLGLDLLSTSRRLCFPADVSSYGSTPVFSDEKFGNDDIWKRTGYQLQDYKANYEKLRKIPASESHPKAIGEVGSYSPERTGGYGSTKRGFTSRANLLYLASLYVASRPARSNDLFYRAHIADIGLLQKRELPKHRQQRLRLTIQFRLAMNERANLYAHALNLHRLPPIEKWRRQSPYFGDEEEIVDLVHDAKLFRRPPSSAGLHADELGGPYQKPDVYLARALAEAGYNCDETSLELLRLHSMIKEGWFMDYIAKEAFWTDEFQDSIRRTKAALATIKGSRHEAPRGNYSRTSLAETGWMN